MTHTAYACFLFTTLSTVPLFSVVFVCVFVCLSACQHDEPLEISSRNIHGIILWSKGRTSSKTIVQGCTGGENHRRRNRGGNGGARPRNAETSEAKVSFRPAMICQVYLLVDSQSLYFFKILNLNLIMYSQLGIFS